MKNKLSNQNVPRHSASPLLNVWLPALYFIVLSCLLSGCAVAEEYPSAYLILSAVMFLVSLVPLVIMFVVLESPNRRIPSPEDYFGDSYNQSTDSQEKEKYLSLTPKSQQDEDETKIVE